MFYLTKKIPMRQFSGHDFLVGNGSKPHGFHLNKALCWDDCVNERILSGILLALYATLAIVAAVQLTRIIVRTRKWATQQWLFAFIIASSVGRSIFCACLIYDPSFRMTMDPENKTASLLNPNSNRANFVAPIFYNFNSGWTIILSAGPQVLFFTTFTLLVLSWGQEYSLNGVQLVRRSREIRRTALIIFGLLNALAYIIVLMLFVLLEIAPQHKHAKLVFGWALAIGSCVLYFSQSCSFLGFGLRLQSRIKHVPVDFSLRQQMQREITIMMGVCFVSFLCKSFLSIFFTGLFDASFCPELVMGMTVVNWYIVSVAYYFILEIFPTALIMWFHSRLPPSGVRGEDFDVRLIVQDGDSIADDCDDQFSLPSDKQITSLVD